MNFLVIRRPLPRLALVGLLAFGLAAGITGARQPIPESDIIFSHALHAGENEIECVQCHEDISGSEHATDRNLPTMDACAECHDVEDETNCNQCHRNPDDPTAPPERDLAVRFNHKRHLAMNLACVTCHGAMAQAAQRTAVNNFPPMSTCMECHNDTRAKSDCAVCHDDRITLTDFHPAEWRHQHGEQAPLDEAWCAGCHGDNNFCLDCHRGDNLTGNVHDLNFQFTHGLEAGGKESDCTRCHDRGRFCNDCHQQENRMPLAHSSLAWRSGHGQAARTDIENCASCHEEDDPTCARGGCHADSDGLRGTDPRFHPPGLNRFDTEGPWHNDGGYSCYVCHTKTNRAGVGFCGYCHGFKD